MFFTRNLSEAHNILFYMHNGNTAYDVLFATGKIRKDYILFFNLLSSLKLTETLSREIFYRIYLLKLWQDRQYDLL